MAKERVLLLDTTRRDGEQSAGIGMTGVEKMEIARQLQKMQVDIIEAGFAASSPGDFESLTNIAKEIDGPIIASLARAVADDVDQAAKAVEHSKRPRIHVFLSSSEIHQMHQLRKNREDVLEMAVRSVERAKGYCDDIEFSPMDATRTNPEYLFHMLEEVIKAGATTINIADTVGYAIPSATGFGQLLKDVQANVKGIENVVLSVHCHNDLGLAVANSLIAVEFGARQVEGCINGIGERAGNASIEEIIMGLDTRKDHFNVEIGADTTQIYGASRMVSRITGMSVQANKAIVGENAFRHASGIHQDGVLKAPITYEIMTPDSIGRTSNELVLGKHSGRHAFKDRLGELGFELEGERFERAFTRFKDLADAKKTIFNEDLESSVAGSVVATDDRFVLGDLSIASGTFTKPSATVELLVDGEARKTTALGVGPVDALFKAIADLSETKSELIRYEVHAVTAGLDAQGEVSVTIEEAGRRVIGNGVHEDVMVASAKAYVHALNKLEWHKRRRDVDAPRGI